MEWEKIKFDVLKEKTKDTSYKRKQANDLYHNSLLFYNAVLTTGVILSSFTTLF
jgi:hypothetical protein